MSKVEQTSKLEQVLIIEPQNELKFRGPFNVPVTSYMKLTNLSEKKVLFKIKTTAPKKYCVRPNSGVLEPKKIIEIAICLQPFIFDPAEKNKHKFMVQTVIAPEGEIDFDSLWKNIEPEKLMDSKLKCVFEMPVAAEGGANAVPQENNVDPVVEVKERREVKSSPKIASGATQSQLEMELQKATNEAVLLSDETNLLRQENLQLKEEIRRLKQNAGSASTGAGVVSLGGAGVTSASLSTKYNPPMQTPNAAAFIVAAVAIALFGIFLGKFAL